MLELMEGSGELTSLVTLTELLLGLVDVKSLLFWHNLIKTLSHVKMQVKTN